MSFRASDITIEKTTNSKTPLPREELVFGKTFTDHMLEIEWTADKGWGKPHISPYHNLSLDPASCVLHYAFELFEGMKAYLDENDNVRTFRPDMNMARMKRSAIRASLPDFDGEELIKSIEQLLLVDKKFIPKGDGYSLYIRPTLIGTTSSLGVGTPNRALLFVIMSPVGPYFGNGFKPVSLEATNYAVRAWPKGVGEFKLGANYVSGIQPQKKAAESGHNQNLWLFGDEGYITEVGAMNVFFVFKNDDGKFELTTAPLDGMILPGVTRDSILALARERLDKSKWEVTERKLTIHEVKERGDKGQVVEAFGAGTAAIVSPINNIEFEGHHIKIPCGANGAVGDLTNEVSTWIKNIQYGKDEFKNWSRIAK